MSEKNVAQYIVDILIKENFSNLYCLPGVQNDDFFDTLYDYQNVLSPIHTRHEQGAGYMALGAALATGKSQIFCIVPGPGFLNGATALATAYSANAPVLALIGHIPTSAIDKDFGLLHEIPQQTEILSALTKKTISVRNDNNAGHHIRDAFVSLKSGTPRPVGLEVPVNIWKQPISDTPPLMDIHPNPIIAESALDKAVALIQNATRPMIVVGSGAQNSSMCITELAEKIHAPVASYRMGRGVMSDHNPLSINNPTSHKLWHRVDVVIGLGTRLQQRQIWGMDSNVKIIHVDIEHSRLHSMGTADVAIHGDCTDVVTGVLSKLSTKKDSTDWRGEVAEVKAQVQAQIHQDVSPQMQYIQAVRTALPDDGILVEELTQTGFVARFGYPVYHPRTYISHGYQGTLGWGLATALGVAHARRDVPVVSINGDGGFMFTMPELATAVHHNIPLNIVVFNDNAFGNVKRFQIDNYNNRTIACDLTNPDFIQLATSFGISATRVTTPNALETQLKQDIKTNAPTLIEVTTPEMPSPWNYILMPKTRGLKTT